MQADCYCDAVCMALSSRCPGGAGGTIWQRQCADKACPGQGTQKKERSRIMFTDFLYVLRAYGMKASLNEWNMLLEALSRNLNAAGLTEFYHMARCILVKRVEDYDRFDQAFAEYFRHVADMDVLPPQVMRWLAKTMSQTPFDQEEVDAVWEGKTLEEIREMMRRRLEEQKEEHHGGCKWVGTGGETAYGHDGYAPFGIRVYGKEGVRRSALEVAGERRFRDFRDDNTVQIRDFQMALKKLRLLSMRDDAAKTEFNVERTIDETSKNAGLLKIVMERPRKNQTKLLLLMDSGGSMWSYTDLCSRLFNAVNRSTHFKDLRVFYFHNCIYDEVYRTPACRAADSVLTEWILGNLSAEYKVILVGDASMAPSELYDRGAGTDYFRYYSGNYLNAYRIHRKTGEAWLRLLRQHFPASIWLNPLHRRLWDYDYGSRTIMAVREIFPMYQLSAAGLERGIRELLNPDRRNMLT